MEHKTLYALTPLQQFVTIGNPEFIRGFYYYEWRDCNIPFYVGMGAGRRAWKPHLYLPEKRRRESTVFRVYIVKQGLTKKQAHLHERYHIIELTRRGLTLYNTRVPRKVWSTKSIVTKASTAIRNT